MTTGPDGPEEEELLLEELVPEADDVVAPVLTELELPEAAIATDAGAPPFEEAAAEDARADAQLLGREADGEAAPERRAALLVEVARLAEVMGDAPAALEAARAAFAAWPASASALSALRRLLSAQSRWDELARAYDSVLASAPLASEDRADTLVERGRVLEDRLNRADEAREGYAAALEIAPNHGPALLALFLAGARAGDGAALEAGLAGLARRADTPARRAALAAALSRLARLAAGEGGAARALRVVRDALHARAAEAPRSAVTPLLSELDALSRTGDQPAIAARALKELAHQEGLGAPWAAALLRERARLLRDHLGDTAGALEALEGAARLAPGHALVAADLVDLAAELERFDVVERVVTRFAGTAGRDDERAQALALRQVAALGRAGRLGEALAALETAPALKRAAGQPAVFGLRLALHVRARDAVGLAAALEADAARAGGAPGARALTFAGAVRQWWAGDAAGAEALYRRALAADPDERAAWDALQDLLVAQRRWDDLAELLEGALAEVAGATGAAERELSLREDLVALYRDQLGDPARAFVHAKQLVVQSPRDVRRRVRLRDLELAGGSDASDVAEAAAEEVESLRVLAAEADDAPVAAALEVEAARLLGTAGAIDQARELLLVAAPEDVTGLGTALLEAALAAPDERARVVARELEGVATDAPVEVSRALRFRLAHHHAAAGRFAEAVAALTPLRAEEDPLARAWSWELARRSRDAILEVAVLPDEDLAGGGALGAPVDVQLALGEARERAGDAAGAAEAFARALALGASADAALGLLRVAAATPAVSPEAMSAALAAIAEACGDEPRVAAAAGREEALLRVASGAVAPEDLVASAPEGATPVERAEAALVRWAAGVARGDAGVVAEALGELGAVMAETGSGAAADPAPLLARASARVRLAGPARSEALHERLWRGAHGPELATALADLPVAPGAAWPAARPDPRRARATRVGGGLGLALDLEAALDAERRGALGAALDGYGRVIGAAPEHLEAWEGIRRVAHAGGDRHGEARALARLGMLLRAPAVAGAHFAQAAGLYEQLGSWDEARTLWGHVLAVAPDDAFAYERLRALLSGDLEPPDGAEAFDRLLAHRLTRATLDDGARIELLFERAQHRLERLNDAAGASLDFKRILKIDPRHVAAHWRLAMLAVEVGDSAAAAGAFERFLAAAPEDPRGAEARLELATAYEATHDRARAVETLRRAAALRPGDPAPLERLVELHTRLGEWRSAVEVLRDWEARLPATEARADLQLRIGVILRDVGRDPSAAAMAFRRAAELDPLGEGGRALVALHDTQQDGRGAVQTIEREIAELRLSLGRDPLDEPRLARLDDFLAELERRAKTPAVSAARAAVAEVRSLLRDEPDADATGMHGRPRAAPARIVPGSDAGRFWGALAYPGATGFRAEIWPHLVEAASALFPPSATAPPPRARRLVPGDEQRLVWVEATAAACGLVGLPIYLSSAVSDAEPAVIIETPAPALVLGNAALDPKASTRFLVGRALGILRAQGAIVDRVEPASLGPLFASAALVAGATQPQDLPRPDAATERTIDKAMSRRDRKALGLQASRFGFETIDPTRWGQAVRRTADRLGLLLAGDVAAAARAAARTDPARWKNAVRKTADRLGQLLAGGPAKPEPEAPPKTPLEEVRSSERALDLVRFALGDAYAVLRAEAEDED